jgi:hypothetical protein
MDHRLPEVRCWPAPSWQPVHDLAAPRLAQVGASRSTVHRHQRRRYPRSPCTGQAECNRICYPGTWRIPQHRSRFWSAGVYVARRRAVPVIDPPSLCPGSQWRWKSRPTATRVQRGKIYLEVPTQRERHVRGLDRQRWPTQTYASPCQSLGWICRTSKVRGDERRRGNPLPLPE